MPEIDPQSLDPVQRRLALGDVERGQQYDVRGVLAVGAADRQHHVAHPAVAVDQGAGELDRRLAPGQPGQGGVEGLRPGGRQPFEKFETGKRRRLDRQQPRRRLVPVPHR
jgi:hypothetical protein